MWQKRVGVKREKSAEQALSSLMALCSRAEHSIGDARRLMSRWGIEQADQQSIIERLIADKFIDDKRYATAFVRDKQRFNGWGERKIAAELARKGVERTIIEDELSKLNEEDIDEQLYSILTTKLRSVKYQTTRQLRDKLMRFALSRGYTMDQCFRAVDRTIDDIDNE